MRYQRKPTDLYRIFDSVYKRFSEREDAHHARMSLGTYLTLSRYFHHNRWVWSVQASKAIAISASAVHRILLTLIRTRLNQGFHFAHSQEGIQTLAVELPMTVSGAETSVHETHPTCVVQYVIFPPYNCFNGSVVSSNIRWGHLWFILPFHSKIVDLPVGQMNGLGRKWSSFFIPCSKSLL